MASSPPMKRQKTEIDTGHQLIQSKNSISIFESLFSTCDWFLVELGRWLLYSTKSDNDLLSILCLNRKINERASIIFRNYFLNIPLHKEIIQLVESQQFKQVEQIFNLSSLSLNPNIKFHFPKTTTTTTTQEPNQITTTIPQCVHLDQTGLLKTPVDIYLPCTCVQNNIQILDKIPLLVVASRIDSISWFESLLYHPRMNWKEIHIAHMNEVFNWCVLKNHLNAVEFILTDPAISTRFQWNLPYERYQFDLRFAISCCLFFGFNEMFDVLGKYGGIKVTRPGYTVYCENSVTGDGLKQFKHFLKSPMIKFNDELAAFLCESIASGADYVLEAAEYVFNHFYEEFFSDLQEQYDDEAIEVMNLLSECCTENGDKRSAKISMSFAFGMAFHREFKSLLTEREWEDQDLLDLFQYSNSERDQFEVTKLLLQNLSEEANILPSHVENFLIADAYNQYSFKLIWHDKRFEKNRTNEWTMNFILGKLMGSYPENVAEFFQSSKNNDLMSATVTFPIQNVVTGESKQITTQFRNQCLLFGLKYPFSEHVISLFYDKFEVKITEELLDWAIFVNCYPKNCLDLFRSKIPDSWWTSERVNSWLLKCNPCSEELIKAFLEAFPNLIDFSWKNNNDFFRRLLNAQYSLTFTFPYFEEHARFNSEEERDEFRKLAETMQHTAPYAEKISKMKLMTK